MRRTLLMLAAAIAVTATPVCATQDPRIPQAEQDADRIEAQAMYDRQRQRDQAEADRIAKETVRRQTDYELYLARQKAEQDAKMAAWRAEVARQKAEYEAQVARCLGGDRTACAPK
jgi:hypothetical protein